MNVSYDQERDTGYVSVADRDEHRVVELDADAFASLDASGELVGLELLDTTRFGSPFDDAAARRAIEWARRQLQLGSAS
jgi:uncharacterized protein YuzE